MTCQDRRRVIFYRKVTGAPLRACLQAVRKYGATEDIETVCAVVDFLRVGSTP